MRPRVCSAVKIALLIENQNAVRIFPIARSVAETVENLLVSGRGDFEDGAAAVNKRFTAIAALIGCAVEVAFLIENQARSGELAIAGIGAETVEQLLLASR